MGGCVSGLMDRKNNKSVCDFPTYRQYATYGPQSIALKGTEKGDRSAIYRMCKTSDEEYTRLTKEWYEGGTCLQIVEKLCKERGKSACLAYRNIVNVEKNKVTDKNGKEKVFETYVFDTKRQTMSYELFWDNVLSFGRGLREIGLQKGSRVAIFEETRWQWLNTLYSCWSQQMVVATVYANLGEDALVYALSETKCDAIVCNGSSVGRLLKIFAKAKNPVKPKIIYLDNLEAGVEPKDYEIYFWGDLMHKGKQSKLDHCIPTGSNKDDVALVMYTSGTTGNPKGVIHTHGSLHAGVQAINQRIEDLLGPIKEEEWYCSYLPMAHIMEMAVVSVLMMRGVIIGYGSPRTLTDQFAKPHGDLSEYQPSLLVAVPRVFDTIKKAVLNNLPKAGTLKRTVFDNAYQARLKALKEGKDTPYYNQKVFTIPRAAMGGKVYAMLCGGGPLSESTQEFINVVFGMVVQGYGLTETVCCGCIQRTGNLQYNSVGQIIKAVELQLRDTEEFKHTDKPLPRGEICLRGPFLFKGYFEQPELTKEALDSDGWFHTGDVGAIAENGAVQLVGRVKALAKNANGEYIAMESLESIYGTNEIAIPNCVCVLVNPHRSYIALLVLTNEKLVEDFKRKMKLSAPSFPEVLKDPEFNKKVLQSFQQTARDAGRKSFEVAQSVMLLNDEWTPENGILTAAFKLRRSQIDKKYKKEIEELFKSAD